MSCYDNSFQIQANFCGQCCRHTWYVSSRQKLCSSKKSWPRYMESIAAYFVYTKMYRPHRGPPCTMCVSVCACVHKCAYHYLISGSLLFCIRAQYVCCLWFIASSCLVLSDLLTLDLSHLGSKEIQCHEKSTEWNTIHKLHGSKALSSMWQNRVGAQPNDKPAHLNTLN